MSPNSMNIIMSDKTKLRRNEFVKTCKNANCLLQLVLDHVQEFERRIEDKFGPQLIKGVRSPLETNAYLRKCRERERK